MEPGACLKSIGGGVATFHPGNPVHPVLLDFLVDLVQADIRVNQMVYQMKMVFADGPVNLQGESRTSPQP